MKEVFVDTAFWIARTFPRDAHHGAAKLWSKHCRQHPLVTTDSVLGEVGAFFAGKGAQLRRAAVDLVSAIEEDPNVILLPDARDLVKQARKLYAARPDKGYSLVDCHSMVVMRARNIQVALTTDEHFEQEGFIALLRKDPADAAAWL